MVEDEKQTRLFGKMSGSHSQQVFLKIELCFYFTCIWLCSLHVYETTKKNNQMQKFIV